MPLIPDSLIDEIQSRVDIAEVIGRYVPLKRAGRHFKANCPFHKERTPSFNVNTDKQIFHCFGCGVGGSVFNFLMQHDRLSFPEAVRQMADHVGVTIPEAPSERNEERDALLTLMDKACRYFERALEEPRVGQATRAYLQRRGVPDATRQAYRLGLAPAGWTNLVDAAGSTGVKAAQLEAAGLAIPGRNGHYDRFRERVIFPIMDLRGRVLGFGGRALGDEKPKYLNSPETLVYTKGRQLFGLTQAKDAIVQAKTAVIVEGYFDAVVLAGAGIANVVSPQGTALTADQGKLLKRYAERIVLAFDADAAGEQATLRGVDLLVELGLDVRVASLPENVDPDEYVQAHGRDKLQARFDEAVGIFEFLLQVAMKRHPGAGMEARVAAAQFVLPTIARVPDAMLRSESVRLLADRLRLDPAAVTAELGKAQARTTAPPRAGAPKAVAARPKPAAMPGPERMLAALLLEQPERWDARPAWLIAELMSDPALRRLVEIVSQGREAGRPLSAAQVASRVSEEGHAGLVAELTQLAHDTPSKETAFEECLRRLGRQVREHQLDALKKEIEQASPQDQQRLLADYQRLRVADAPQALHAG